MKLTFENPWTLVAHVKEKGKSGYVSFNDTNLYFDRKGTALLKARKLLQEYLMWKDFLSMHRK